MLCELHQGEIETIKIALQLSADYVFIDDVDARHVADANLQKLSAATNLKGTLGILIELYQKKLIDALENGFLWWIHHLMLQHCLQPLQLLLYFMMRISDLIIFISMDGNMQFYVREILQRHTATHKHSEIRSRNRFFTGSTRKSFSNRKEILILLKGNGTAWFCHVYGRDSRQERLRDFYRHRLPFRSDCSIRACELWR